MSGAIFRSSALAVGIIATSLGTSGCGAVFDLTYLIGSNRYEESATERRPTGQVSTAIEYESTVSPDGQMRLVCEERERSIERTWSVQKTFQRRGSYDSSAYVGTATISALATVITGVVIGVICIQDAQDPTKEEKLSCLNMLYATPTALDMGWSIYRATTAKPAKLVDKQKSEGQLDYAAKPTRTTPMPCDSVKQVVLGNVNGASAQEILNGNGGGREPRLADGAVAVAVASDGTIALATQPDVAKVWAIDATLDLVVVDQESKPHRVNVDRCSVMRPLLTKLPPTEMTAVVNSCAPPKPAK